MKKFIVPNIEEENTITKTIRIKKILAKRLDEIAYKNNITVNRLINECILYALDNMEDDSQNSKDKE